MKRDVVTYTHITTDTVIANTGAIFYGAFAYCNTTGPSKVLIFDSAVTAAGNMIWGLSATGSAASQQALLTPAKGIACKLGIYANVTMTSGVDTIVIFHGPAT